MEDLFADDLNDWEDAQVNEDYWIDTSDDCWECDEPHPVMRPIDFDPDDDFI